MSSPQYETKKELIEEIKNIANEFQQRRVAFLLYGNLCSFYLGTHEVEVAGVESSMTLEQFGDQYNAQGLTELLRTMQRNKSILESI